MLKRFADHLPIHFCISPPFLFYFELSFPLLLVPFSLPLPLPSLCSACLASRQFNHWVQTCTAEGIEVEPNFAAGVQLGVGCFNVVSGHAARYPGVFVPNSRPFSK